MRQSCAQHVLIGIGQGRVTQNLDGAAVDFAVYVPDEDSVVMVDY